MSTRAPTSSIPASEVGRLQLERSIDHLADLARSDIEAGRFFGEVLGRAIQPGGATRATLWQQALEGQWQPVGQSPPSEPLDTSSIEQRQELLSDVSGHEHPRVVAAPQTARASSLVLSPIRHNGHLVGILETEHPHDPSGQLPPDTIHFFAALCEITADFLSQQELQQLRRARATWQQWDQYQHQLWRSLELPAVCAAISNDGRLLADCDRVSVLVRCGRSYPLQSVSGVERIEPRSTATRSLESLASLVSRHGQPVWWGGMESPTKDGSPADLEEALQRHARDAGATAIGLIPVSAPRDDQDASPPLAVILFEQFQPLRDLTAWRSRGESLANRSGATLRAAWERNEVPWFGLWRQMRRLPLGFLRPTTLLVLLLMAGIASALVLIPAEFTVDGPAELWPARRREVFASTSGIVDNILVAHGDEVEQDQPLVLLRDPTLEADTPRIIGEIATVNERLKGVQAARISGGNTPDAMSRARQLTADEEELKERLRTLEQQRLLIEERQAALTLRSPIAGKVLTWDTSQLLSARPVERGQSLLTIGETTGPWILEMRVADKNAGHMLRARQSLTPQLDVDFLLAAEPGRTYRGRVQEVSQNAEADEISGSHVRVVVAFDRTQIEQLRPGATALPRIHCGQRSLGYVWLHDLIDAVRTRLLF